MGNWLELETDFDFEMQNHGPVTLASEHHRWKDFGRSSTHVRRDCDPAGKYQR